MAKWVLSSLFGLAVLFAPGAEVKVSQLGVPAEKIGPDWSGPIGLVVDDIDAPPPADRETAAAIAGLRKEMKALGVQGAADFTYRRKSNPLQQVTLRVFLFRSEERCREWMKTRYQFAGWERKYRRVEEKEYAGFDSLEMRKRIVSVGTLWITAGTTAENDDHLKVLNLFLERLKQHRAPAGQPGAR